MGCDQGYQFRCVSAGTLSSGQETGTNNLSFHVVYNFSLSQKLRLNAGWYVLASLDVYRFGFGYHGYFWYFTLLFAPNVTKT